MFNRCKPATSWRKLSFNTFWIRCCTVRIGITFHCKFFIIIMTACLLGSATSIFTYGHSINKQNRGLCKVCFASMLCPTTSRTDCQERTFAGELPIVQWKPSARFFYMMTWWNIMCMGTQYDETIYVVHFLATAKHEDKKISMIKVSPMRATGKNFLLVKKHVYGITFVDGKLQNTSTYCFVACVKYLNHAHYCSTTPTIGWHAHRYRDRKTG